MKIDQAKQAIRDLEPVRLEWELISSDGENFNIAAPIVGKVLGEKDLDRICEAAKAAGAQFWIEQGRAVLR